jgi:hypothetical protein
MTSQFSPADLPPDAPPAHQFLAEHWPYLIGASRRIAPRLGLDADDLVHEFAVHIFETFAGLEEVLQRGFHPRAFVAMRIKQVIGRRFFVRWRNLYHDRHDLTDADLLVDRDDPADAADLADALAAVRAALVRLERMYPRRAEGVRLRFGIGGGDAVAGAELGAALGVRGATAGDLVTSGLKTLAWLLGADPDRARVSHAEGVSMGQKVKHAKRRALRTGEVAV